MYWFDEDIPLTPAEKQLYAWRKRFALEYGVKPEDTTYLDYCREVMGYPKEATMDEFCGLKKGELIYLASPFGPDKALRAARAERARKLTTALMLKGFCVYTPIVYGSHLVSHDPRLEEFDWLAWDMFMLQHCSKLAVFQQDGWLESPGVLKEMIRALENDMPICYIPEIALSNLISSMAQEHLEKGRAVLGHEWEVDPIECEPERKTVRQGGVDVVPCSEEQQQVEEAMQRVFKDKPELGNE